MELCENCKYNSKCNIYMTNHCQILNNVQTPYGFGCNQYEEKQDEPSNGKDNK